MMEIEQFKDLAAGLESLIIAAGVVIGGLWARFQFRALKSMELANANLAQEIKRLREAGTLTITINVSQLPVADSPLYFILAEIVLANTGNRSESIDWSQSTVVATRILTDSQGVLAWGPQYVHTVDTNGLDMSSSVIRPGQAKTVPFILPVQQPGLYSIRLQAKGSPQEEQLSKQEDSSQPSSATAYFWHSTKIFVVE